MFPSLPTRSPNSIQSDISSLIRGYVRHMARNGKPRSEVEVDGQRRIGRLAGSIFRALTGGSCLALLMCGLFFLGPLAGFAGDVVLIQSKAPDPVEDEAIRRLADFYGFELYTVDSGSKGAVDRVASQLRNPGTRAVLISQDALARLDRKQIQEFLRKSNGLSIPILIFGVRPGEDANELKFWSAGNIQECAPFASNFRPKTLEVMKSGTLTSTLSGLKLPAVASPVCSMRFNPAAPAIQTVLAARADNQADIPVLVRIQSEKAETFFTPRMETFDMSWRGTRWGLPGAFSSMAPFIFFLSNAAGDYGWHLDGHYANLTIDDAWLTRAYGHLDYAALLAEMEKHNFHTTIAFIPWNFDRSKPDVVALFRAHPERFSIAVHGNNHDHREFDSYAVNSLQEQITDVKQGIARMERFQALTHISYDRFMVFPHDVAPQETFAVLKRYDFLGTANVANVPLGAKFPADPMFLLRPYTDSYENLLSMSRSSAGAQVPQLETAIQSFLGNPLLLYGHEDLFVEGIGAFNAFADDINRVQPDTKWISLGEIARHSHLIRKREDGGFDVRMFSNEMELENPTDRDAVFYVKREEPPLPAIRQVMIDGIPSTFERTGSTTALRLEIPAHQIRKIRVTYQNDLDTSQETTRKSDLGPYALRRISDFRDLYLTKIAFGRAIKKEYYRYGWDSIELRLEQKWWVYTTSVLLAFGALWFHRRRTRKKQRKDGGVELWAKR